MKGKIIYESKGSAAEYARCACNFYVGCSNACTYCFNKRWGWGNVPTLKKCFKNEEHALEVFEKELMANLSELQKHGFLLSFTKYVGFNTPREAYAALFDKINGKGSFERNPYVFCYSFKLIK